MANIRNNWKILIERTCLRENLNNPLLSQMPAKMCVFLSEFPEFSEKSPQRCSNMIRMPQIFGKSHK